jgi:hypothetical protein
MVINTWSVSVWPGSRRRKNSNVVVAIQSAAPSHGYPGAPQVGDNAQRAKAMNAHHRAILIDRHAVSAAHPLRQTSIMAAKKCFAKLIG